MPTLILVGDADIPDVHAHAGAIETGIPNSRRIVVSDAGHLMYLEKPEEFTRIVIHFLEANRFLTGAECEKAVPLELTEHTGISFKFQQGWNRFTVNVSAGHEKPVTRVFVSRN